MVTRMDLSTMLYVWCLSYFRYSPSRAKATSLLMFLDPTQLDTNAHARTHAHVHIHTLTHGSTPLKEGSARRRRCCLHNTQQTQGKTTQTVSGIRTSNPSNGEP